LIFTALDAVGTLQAATGMNVFKVV